eukprot:scaffold248563_cov28-Tisochrysis_lutea.AAC.1
MGSEAGARAGFLATPFGARLVLEEPLFGPTRWYTSFVSVEAEGTNLQPSENSLSCWGLHTRFKAQKRTMAPRAVFACTAGPGNTTVTTGTGNPPPGVRSTALAYSCDATFRTKLGAFLAVLISSASASVSWLPQNA